MPLPPLVTAGAGRGRLRALRRHLRNSPGRCHHPSSLTLWEGRDAEQLSRWLREHPGVEIVCRDGSLTYRQGIIAGAPEAIQISDRFHMWQGLSRRVQDIAA
ncbi:transposase [Streptomyces sp. NPDC051366]|uniref:transposase n=1 Tax=Streptomyces sp. NPDC051366 TaxID=3365652 RepID=UPI0037B070F0